DLSRLDVGMHLPVGTDGQAVLLEFDGSFHVAVNVQVFLAVDLAVNFHGFPDAGLAARTARLRGLKGCARQRCCLLLHWFFRIRRRSRRQSWPWSGSPFLATFVEDTHERAAARRRSVSCAALAECERVKQKQTGSGPARIVDENFQHLQ